MPTISGESVSSSVSQPTTTRSAHRAVDESSVAAQSRRKPRWRRAESCGARPSRARKSIGITGANLTAGRAGGRESGRADDRRVNPLEGWHVEVHYAEAAQESGRLGCLNGACPDGVSPDGGLSRRGAIRTRVPDETRSGEYPKQHSRRCRTRFGQRIQEFPLDRAELLERAGYPVRPFLRPGLRARAIASEGRRPASARRPDALRAAP